MTTVTWDGYTMAADSLATDHWGLRETSQFKILVGADFLIGYSGNAGHAQKWWRGLEPGVTAANLLKIGYPDFVEDKNDPQIMLVCAEGIFRHVSGVFMDVDRPYFAVGSGRDYALAALHMGADAAQAVRVAMAFDVNTGGDVVECKSPF